MTLLKIFGLALIAIAGNGAVSFGWKSWGYAMLMSFGVYCYTYQAKERT